MRGAPHRVSDALRRVDSATGGVDIEERGHRSRCLGFPQAASDVRCQAVLDHPGYQDTVYGRCLARGAQPREGK